MAIIAHLHDVHTHWANKKRWDLEGVRVCSSASLCDLQTPLTWNVFVFRLESHSLTMTIRAIQRLVLHLLKDSFYFYNRPLSPNTSQRAPCSHRCAMPNQNTTNTLVSISKLLWLHLWKNTSRLQTQVYHLLSIIWCNKFNNLTICLQFQVVLTVRWGIFINFGSNNHNSSSLPS